MTGETDERTVRRRAAFPRFFVGPELRRDDKNAVERRREHMRVRRHVEVVVNLIFPVEVRESGGDWVLRVDEINADVAFIPLGLFFAVPTPRPSLGLPFPFLLIS